MNVTAVHSTDHSRQTTNSVKIIHYSSNFKLLRPLDELAASVQSMSTMVWILRCTADSVTPKTSAISLKVIVVPRYHSAL